jgi:hypothetical protein
MFTDSKAIIRANMSPVESVMSNLSFVMIRVSYHRLDGLSSRATLGLEPRLTPAIGRGVILCFAIVPIVPLLHVLLVLRVERPITLEA